MLIDIWTEEIYRFDSEHFKTQYSVLSNFGAHTHTYTYTKKLLSNEFSLYASYFQAYLNKRMQYLQLILCWNLCIRGVSENTLNYYTVNNNVGYGVRKACHQNLYTCIAYTYVGIFMWTFIIGWSTSSP